MDISDEELFASATSDEPVAALTEEAPQEAPVAEEAPAERQRDEQGRFVAKTEEPEPKPEPEAAKPVETESVGMKQIREAYERAQRRVEALEQRFLAQQPKPEPQPRPDMFEKPDAFVGSHIQEALTPLQQQFSTFIETVSRRDAIREHGQERVSEAYKALDQAASNGDAQALAIVKQVKQSMDPYGDIVSWYKSAEAAHNPQGFFERQLNEALKDEKFAAALKEKLQVPAAIQAEKPKAVFNVPPSLNRATSAQPSASDLDSADMSNESLFKFALG